MAENPVQIVALRRLSPEQAAQSWRLYEEAFLPVAALSPFAQSLSREDFADFVMDEGSHKFLALQGDDVCGVAILTTRPHQVRWLSEEYFSRLATKWGDAAPVFYLIGIATNGSAPSGVSLLLIDAAASLCVESRGVFVFDYAHAAHSRLEGVAAFIARRHGYAVGELDQMTSVVCAPHDRIPGRVTTAGKLRVERGAD